jgi:hypothetical protein
MSWSDPEARASSSTSVWCLRENLERLRQQSIAGEDGDAFAEHFVVGRLAAAEIVVVHRGQIIVDQRIGVDALDRTRRRQGVHVVPAAGLGRGEDERRPHPLAPGEERVAHGAVNGRGLHRFLREKTVEGFVDPLRATVEEVLQIERNRMTRPGACGGGRHAGCL